MTPERRARRIRLGAFLAAALAFGPACPQVPIEDTDYFLVSNGCSSESATVSAESKVSTEQAVDTIDVGEECLPAPGRALLDVDIDGVPTYVEAVPVRDLGSTRLSCVHAFTGEVSTTCSVAASSTLELWETGGIGLGTSYVAFEADLSSLGVAPGPPGDPDQAVATVTVECEGGVQPVPVGGDPVLAPISGAFANCSTTLELSSDVETPGSHVRVLTLQHRPLSSLCDFDVQCEETFPGTLPICGPNGGCQAGVEGDACIDRFDCDAAAAPHCVEAQCRDGSSGDPCYDGGDCAGGVCVAGACG